MNALSTWMEAYVSQDGYEHYQKFEIGIPVEPVKQLGVSDKRGTTIRWSAYPLIFSETTTYNFDVLANRMRELSFLNSGITIILRDERLTNSIESVFKFEGGISHFVA